MPPDNKPAAPTVKQGGSAWHIDFPLGFHIPTELDTLPYNYQIRNIAALQSIAFATTGNVGGPGQNEIFFERKPRSEFFFADALRPWLPTSLLEIIILMASSLLFLLFILHNYSDSAAKLQNIREYRYKKENIFATLCIFSIKLLSIIPRVNQNHTKFFFSMRSS